jgi:hypothetical protein
MNEMKEIFHDILNDLNAISIVAGSTVEVVKIDNDKESNDVDKMKKNLDKAIDALNDSENAAFCAAEKIKAIKKKVYAILEKN